MGIIEVEKIEIILSYRLTKYIMYIRSITMQCKFCNTKSNCLFAQLCICAYTNIHLYQTHTHTHRGQGDMERERYNLGI